MICKIILIILALFLILLVSISIIKLIWSDFKTYIISFFSKMTLTEEEQEIIERTIKKQYKDSSLYKILNTEDISEESEKNQSIDEKENINLLLQIKEYYRDEINIFNNDYNEFLKKIDFMFKMFATPIPIYMTLISYILKKHCLYTIEYAILIFAIIIYLFFFIRVIWIQSLKNGFTKIKIELPFLISDISIKKYLITYIINSAINLKIQRENLLRLKNKIQYINAQYIISSALLIIIIIVVYLI